MVQHRQWEAHGRQQALTEAEASVVHAQQHYDELRQQLDGERIPENETIARLRGAIVNLQTTRKSVDKARSERDEAMKVLLAAEAAVNESPFAEQTPEQVRREVSNPPKVKTVGIPAILAVYGAAAALVTAISFMYPDLPNRPALLFIGLPIIVLSSVVSVLLSRRARRKAQDAALTKRFGTIDTAKITALAHTYYKLYEARESAQAELNAKSATADALYASLSSNEQAILLEVRRFAPAAFDIHTADQLLRSCATRRKMLTEAEVALREAQMRRDILRQQIPAAETATEVVQKPLRARETVASQLEQVRTALAADCSTADRLSGQLAAMGDSAVLEANAAKLAAEKESLEGEYAAIRLAMDALESANTTLQNRFSPALGRRAAEVFSALTDGKYSGVVLDRSFHLSAEPVGDAIYRDAQLLSAGASDQLYLAVRLAICELVLPEEKSVPIILDDALANFDDERCAVALRWLKDEAKHRQILLFTCHSREAEFFAGDSEVSIQRLTKEG